MRSAGISSELSRRRGAEDAASSVRVGNGDYSHSEDDEGTHAPAYSYSGATAAAVVFRTGLFS